MGVTNKLNRATSKSGQPPLSLPLSPTEGRRGTVGAHGGAPNVQPPLALEWERGQDGEGGQAWQNFFDCATLT
jgi:hypothetical protein